MRPTGKPGCGTGLLVKCFQVTCCHVALGSQTTPSGNALKEMGRARAPETRGVTHARKPSSPWRFWKHTAGSGAEGGRAGPRAPRELLTGRLFRTSSSGLGSCRPHWCGQESSCCWKERPPRPGGEEVSLWNGCKP